MKKLYLSIAAGAFLAASPVLAADIPANTFFKGQQENHYLAKDILIGAKVHAPDGKIMGDIEDLIVNQDNTIEGVIMGVGGFLGAGEKKVGVRLSAVKIEMKDGKPYVTMPTVTKEALGALEPFKRAHAAKTLMERAMEKARELTDKTSQSSQDAYQSAKEKAGPALEKAKESAGKAYEKAKEGVGQAYEKAKEAIDPNKPAPPAPAPKQ